MKQFTRSLLIVGFIIVALLAVLYYLSEQRPVSVLQVQVVVKGDLNNAAIEDITAHLESVSKISEPKGTLLITPGVTVVVMQNMEMIGDWTSVPYNGSGVYSLTVGLTKYPKPGETIRVVARVMNANSENIDVISKEITLS